MAEQSLEEQIKDVGAPEPAEVDTPAPGPEADVAENDDAVILPDEDIGEIVLDGQEIPEDGLDTGNLDDLLATVDPHAHDEPVHDEQVP